MFARLALGLVALIAILALVACVQIIRNSGQKDLTAPVADAIRLATYNVHYIITFRETGPWSVGDWERRKGPLDLAFKAIDADLIGFQEMESFGGRSASPTNLTLDWLLLQNPGYGAAAVGNPADFPSTQPILYRKDRLIDRSQGWFFFSDTPDVIYSRTFNGSFPAFASWAAFEDKQNGAAFRVVNIHTDFRSRSNRLKSMDLVAARIAPWIAADETLFVMGDFNARHGAQTLKIVGETGIRFPKVQGATYHLNRGINLFGAIDHIGIVGRAQPNGEPIVLRQKFDGEWPTDHYPVILDVALDAEG
ncbi:MAG: endonuclease [Pseudomonadota bacterium]